MKKYVFVLITLLAIAPTAKANDANDIAQIKQTAKNYMEAWYQGDAAKMEESLHKELAKRSIKPGHVDQKSLRLTYASDMVSYTRSGYGAPLGKRHEYRGHRVRSF